MLHKGETYNSMCYPRLDFRAPDLSMNNNERSDLQVGKQKVKCSWPMSVVPFRCILWILYETSKLMNIKASPFPVRVLWALSKTNPGSTGLYNKGIFHLIKHHVQRSGSWQVKPQPLSDSPFHYSQHQFHPKAEVSFWSLNGCWKKSCLAPSLVTSSKREEI